MGSKALPIRLIKFLIIHLHSTGIPPPPHFLSISLALSFPVSLFPSVSFPFLFPFPPSFSVSLSHCRSLFNTLSRADPFNIFLNYIFNGRNKWIIDCFASVQSANRVIINALLQFSHSYKYIIQSIAERFAEISAKCNLRHTKLYIVRSRNSQFAQTRYFCRVKQRKSARLDYLFIPSYRSIAASSRLQIVYSSAWSITPIRPPLW